MDLILQKMRGFCSIPKPWSDITLNTYSGDLDGFYGDGKDQSLT